MIGVMHSAQSDALHSFVVMYIERSTTNVLYKLLFYDYLQIGVQ